jgi:hypothetical protein
MEPLGLDRGVDGLGEQGPGEPPALERPARPELDAGGEPFGHGRVAGRSLGHGVDLALRGAAEDLGEEVGLGREVAVDGARRHAGRGRHRGDLGFAVAAAGDERVRCSHDPFAAARRASVSWWGGTGTKK